MTDGGSRRSRLGPSACQEIRRNRRRNAFGEGVNLGRCGVKPRRGINEAHGVYRVQARKLKVRVSVVSAAGPII